MLSARFLEFMALSLLPTSQGGHFVSNSRSLPRHMAAFGGVASSRASSRANTSKKQPPVARRDPNQVVWAGVAPPGWNLEVPRQSETSTEPLMDPPVAVPDPYGWMRDETREDKEVLGYLQQENDYTQAWTQHLEPVRESIYNELLSYLQETDYSLPRPHGNYVYYSRTFQGKSYEVLCRAPAPPGDNSLTISWDGSADTPIVPEEHVYLDVNTLAEDQEYCSMGDTETSPSERLLAYSVDFTGDEIYELCVQDIQTGETIFEDEELEICDDLVWGNDDQTLFYLKMDDEQRPYQLYRKQLNVDGDGEEQEQKDQLLFEEPDVLFWVGIWKSLDGQYLLVETSSAETSEIHFLDLYDSDATLQCIAKRRPKTLYEVTHRKGTWWIASNVGGTPNLQLLVAPAKANCEEEWTLVLNPDNQDPLFDGSYECALEEITAFSNHVVVEGRQGGIPRIWVLALDPKDPGQVIKSERLEFPEAAHDVGLGAHYEFDVDKIVVGYTSLITPTQGLEIPLNDPSSSSRTVLKERAVPGYNKNLYGCERTTVKSRDGAADIPVSLVYRKDVMERAKNGEPVHTHLYAYGAYGSSEEAEFMSTIVPLLNRGMIYVVAHVRGGGEMGRQWYEEPNGGKYLCKKNTFNDFIDVGRWLVDDRKYTTPDLLSCEGRSAGGMTVGAAINQAPELFKMAILGVPFLDVVGTMTDASIPLTVRSIALVSYSVYRHSPALYRAVRVLTSIASFSMHAGQRMGRMGESQ
jgi:oligopeptidase B